MLADNVRLVSHPGLARRQQQQQQSAAAATTAAENAQAAGGEAVADSSLSSSAASEGLSWRVGMLAIATDVASALAYLHAARPPGGHRGLARHRRRQGRMTFEVIEQRQKIGCADDLDIARPRRLRPLRGGADEAALDAARVQRHARRARRRAVSARSWHTPDGTARR